MAIELRDAHPGERRDVLLRDMGPQERGTGAAPEMSDRKFVKSAETSVPVSRSTAELERVLRRYGCTGFGVSNDYEQLRCAVTIRVPDGPEKDAPQIPVKLVVDFRAVYDALYGQPTKSCNRPDGTWGRMFDPKGYDPKFIQQAERVAWRHLVLWVDAACSASTVGLQRMSEAFLAHTLMRTADGRVLRVVEQMDEAAGGNWKALLPPPKESQ